MPGLPNKTLTIVSLKIECLKSNTVAIQQIVNTEKPDILCLQETCLYSFQKQSADVLEDYDFASKHHDDRDPVQMANLGRGQGGVTTYWKKSLVPQPKPQLDGSERTLVIIFDDIVISNTYMPCRGSHSTQEFQEEVDQLDEICKKFVNRPKIILGDLNVDIPLVEYSTSNIS